MTDVLKFSDLQDLTGYTRQGDVERCLKDQGIVFFWGRKGCWTTLHHLNHPGGRDYAQPSNDPIQF